MFQVVKYQRQDGSDIVDVWPCKRSDLDGSGVEYLASADSETDAQLIIDLIYS